MITPTTQDRKSRGTSWMRVVYLAPVSLVTVMILRWQPYFGNMDDGRFLRAAQSGPFTFAKSLDGSFDTGFIRFGSLLIDWPAYWLGANFGATVFYLANAVLTIGILALFAESWGIAVKAPLAVRLILFSVAFAWPFSADLLAFPSLSEKSIILGGALLLCWSALMYRLPIWASGVLLILFTVFAFTTKPQIVLFIPGVVVALGYNAWTQRERRPVAAVAIALWITLSVLSIWMAQHGTVTGATRGLGGLTVAMHDTRWLLLACATAATVLAVAVTHFRKVSLAAPLVSLALIVPLLVSFFLWWPRNYYLSIASVMVGACIAATVLALLRSTQVQVVIAVILLFVGMALTLMRLVPLYSSLSSVRTFILSSTATEAALSHRPVYVTCVEAPDHYNYYAHLLGRSSLIFAPLQGASAGTGLLLADSRLCPLDSRFTVTEEVWRSGDGGFRLLNGAVTP